MYYLRMFRTADFGTRSRMSGPSLSRFRRGKVVFLFLALGAACSGQADDGKTQDLSLATGLLLASTAKPRPATVDASGSPSSASPIGDCAAHCIEVSQSGQVFTFTSKGFGTGGGYAYLDVFAWEPQSGAIVAYDFEEVQEGADPNMSVHLTVDRTSYSRSSVLVDSMHISGSAISTVGRHFAF